MANLQVMPVIKDGCAIGIKNAPSLIGALILWVLTIWIPYINVGTTIALCSIPVALSKGKVLSPTFIFGSHYRKQMGDFFILEGLQTMAVYASMIFLLFPALVLSYSWSQAVYLLLDKELNPTEALSASNKLTSNSNHRLHHIGDGYHIRCHCYYHTRPLDCSRLYGLSRRSLQATDRRARCRGNNNRRDC